MIDHIANRDQMLKFLRRELVGPAPKGEEVDFSQPVVYETREQQYKPVRQKGSGDEVLMRDPPVKRYGVGVLYPMGTTIEENMEVNAVSGGEVESGAGEQEEPEVSAHVQEQIERIANRTGDDQDGEDFDLSAANGYEPSSMGVSFLAEFPAGSTMIVEATGGRYNKITVKVGGQERLWWLRSAVALRAEYSAEAMCVAGNAKVQAASVASENTEGLAVGIEVFSREPSDGENGEAGSHRRLVTVCLVNRSKASTKANEQSLFQAGFTVSILSEDGAAHILPYQEREQEKPDAEEQSLALLYRRYKTYAVGHGCAADWSRVVGGERVEWVQAECLPVFETPSMTPDIENNEQPVAVSMKALAGLEDGDDGFQSLAEVIELYERWIGERRREAQRLEPVYQEAAWRNIEECERCAKRMHDGLAYLQGNRTAYRAFQLANYAILLQQVRSKLGLRDALYDRRSQKPYFTMRYEMVEPLQVPKGRGMWRAFQIAFLLMAVRSTAEGNVPDRETVELIWFPTGGGKTEAYLGLAAFGMFMRRLENKQDTGVHVLMRYTLRLLTAQQFQRASSLICAMEYLRRKCRGELGKTPFSIGIWLGGDTTPNKRANALADLRALVKGQKEAKNPFLLTRCPWCGAQMGPVKYSASGGVPKSAPRVLGYEQDGTSVIFACPDEQCDFRDGMPVYVIDEDIYDYRPTMVIGTVDKFAMLAWRPEARAIFGIGEDGKRICSPPGLIIQDELHLISGPLGSMVGLYETVIEELCTDRRSEKAIVPKIVSSTATIRRYEDQVKALYGREDVALFPPPGLDAGDSFFGRYARDKAGRLLPGRKYVGVHAPGLGSVQTAQVRTFSALLQGVMELPPEERDPWWTLLLFFNSLRELGTTVTLFQSDIPDYLLVLKNRLGLEKEDRRWLWNILELTSRLKSEEVPEAIAALEVPYKKRATNDNEENKENEENEEEEQRVNPVDACLASSIIEVGIDIDRLSLMGVTGQPKTTSQYIQVTGRVGRSWWERPGLVAMVYGASKPRDRSHFEKFRSYHERLYAQVEPTSVTPFSPPALDRALQAVIVAYVRQVGNEQVVAGPYPYPKDLIYQLYQILLPRVQVIDPLEVPNFERVFRERVAEWKRWGPVEWGGFNSNNANNSLMRPAGAYVTQKNKRKTWPVMQSMRNVDAECQAVITNLYMHEGGEEHA